MIVGHRAVLRCLYAYLVDLPHETIPHLDMPLHTAIKLTPKAYGCEEERFTFGIESVDEENFHGIPEGRVSALDQLQPPPKPKSFFQGQRTQWSQLSMWLKGKRR
eukprot:GABV01008825.1.p1 GENE.GABV01008825.1~~GABV01008825.1.p1  ORF type:complete len:105 (+),score=1.38 GABV01008825.1:356-670(+)